MLVGSWLAIIIIMSSSYSQCGNEGHSSRTCSDGTGGGGGSSNKGFMLFGVRVMEEGCASFRKCASMNNLAQFDHQPQDSNVNDVVNAGYASDDVVHPSARSRERKRGVPWTEDEHRLFLLGLQKVGKGDWRGISRNFVKTRTPTQVASHAQKYFLRRNNHSRRRRRSSLFDITTHDTILSPVLEDKPKQEAVAAVQQQNHLMNNLEKFHEGSGCYSIHFGPVAGAATALASENSPINITLGVKSPSPNLIHPIPVVPPAAIPPSSKMADLNLNKATVTDPLLPSLSLKLPTPSPSPSSSSEQKSPTAARHASASFQAIPNSFDSSSGDSIISVA